ncbi:MAG TPA: amidohydrolase family protein [Segetibacter sp.]
MLKIDSHQHFWKFDPVRDSWITEDMAVIQNDFMPANLQPLLLENGFQGCVTVQSDQSAAHNLFLIKQAQENSFIKGVVGWVDLQAHDIEDQLLQLARFEKMKGFRHVLQGEAERDFMLRKQFMNGISKLKNCNFTYDILIFPDQLRFIPAFVSAFPEQKFVIDHIAKPAIKDGKIEDWKKDIEAVAAYENVWCKISGMVTEADWKGWKTSHFTPYLDAVTEAFGMERIMFGSDWPVCLVAASYKKMLFVVEDHFSAFSTPEQEAFFGGNATEFYNLKS